jgi:hypothetical protein
MLLAFSLPSRSLVNAASIYPLFLYLSIYTYTYIRPFPVSLGAAKKFFFIANLFHSVFHTYFFYLFIHNR